LVERLAAGYLVGREPVEDVAAALLRRRDLLGRPNVGRLGRKRTQPVVVCAERIAVDQDLIPEPDGLKLAGCDSLLGQTSR
jgi:hypothetical protein